MSTTALPRVTGLQRKEAEYDAMSDAYDFLWDNSHDLAFYERLACRYGAPVLELGSGTGRVALSLASKGFAVTGIDISSGMLKHALRRKAEAGPEIAQRLDYRKMSMTDLPFDREFRLVIAPFSTIFELPDDVRRLETYRGVKRSLAPGGCFVFDNWHRSLGSDAGWGDNQRPPRSVQLDRIVPVPGRPGELVCVLSSQDYREDGTMLLTLLLDEVDRGGSVRRKILTLRRKYVDPEETEAELASAGFTDVRIEGGYDGEPFLDPSLRGSGRQIFFAS